MASEDPASTGVGLGDFFRDEYFLQTNGLSVDNAVNYFKLSQFFSARKQWHQSRQYKASTTKTPQVLLIEEISPQAGPEGSAHTTCAWYILNGAILQCPDLHTVVSIRLRNTLRAVRKAAAALERDSGHTVMGGPFWHHAERASKEAEERAAQAGLGLLSDNPTVQSIGGVTDVTSSRNRVETVLAFVAGQSAELRKQLREQQEALKQQRAGAAMEQETSQSATVA